MKRKSRPRTNKFHATEIIVAIIIVASLISLGNTLKKRSERIKSEPTITDLFQQQEMIDYAKSQGRTIKF